MSFEFIPDYDYTVIQWKDWNDPPQVHIGDPDNSGQLDEAQGLRVTITERQTGLSDTIWIYTDEPLDDWDDWQDLIDVAFGQYGWVEA